MVPVGVWLDAGSPLHNEGLYEEPVLAGIVSRAENAETAEAVLESLLIVQN